MIGLGLSNSQLALYSTALRNDHTVSCRVSILDGSENHKAAFTTNPGDDSCPIAVLGGQVDIDTTSASSSPIRKLTLTLLDPKRKLAVGLNTPGDYAVWANTFLRIERGDYVHGIGYVWCPVFTGPIQTFERVWPEVTITAVGKEYLAQAPFGILTSQTIKRGTNVRTAIQNLLTPLGETNFAMARTTATIGGTDVVLPAFHPAWPLCQRFAALAGLQLFYDGMGALRLEARDKTNAVWKFDMSATGMLLSAPDVTYDFTGGQPLGGQISAGSGAFANYVDVVGKAPSKNLVAQPHAAETVAANNDLSPQALGRNGKPRYAIISQSNTALVSQSAAATLAAQILKNSLEVGASAKFDCMPVPHLEEYDWVTVETNEGDLLPVQMNKWSIPLTADAMSVNALRQMAYTQSMRPKRVARKRYVAHTTHKSTKGHR